MKFELFKNKNTCRILFLVLILIFSMLWFMLGDNNVELYENLENAVNDRKMSEVVEFPPVAIELEPVGKGNGPGNTLGIWTGTVTNQPYGNGEYKIVLTDFHEKNRSQGNPFTIDPRSGSKLKIFNKSPPVNTGDYIQDNGGSIYINEVNNTWGSKGNTSIELGVISFPVSFRFTSLVSRGLQTGSLANTHNLRDVILHGSMDGIRYTPISGTSTFDGGTTGKMVWKNTIQEGTLLKYLKIFAFAKEPLYNSKASISELYIYGRLIETKQTKKYSELKETVKEKEKELDTNEKETSILRSKLNDLKANVNYLLTKKTQYEEKEKKTRKIYNSVYEGFEPKYILDKAQYYAKLIKSRKDLNLQDLQTQNKQLEKTAKRMKNTTQKDNRKAHYDLERITNLLFYLRIMSIIYFLLLIVLGFLFYRKRSDMSFVRIFITMGTLIIFPFWLYLWKRSLYYSKMNVKDYIT